MGAVQKSSISAMTTLGLINFLKEKQIHIHVENGRLKINAPIGVVDGALQAELKIRKNDLLAAFGGPSSAEPLIPLTADQLTGMLPLTAAQQGMWLIEHFNPGNVAYNIPEAFRFEWRVELVTFQAAVDQLIARHKILRTSFHEDEGELFQTIAATVSAPVLFNDFSHLDELERERACAALLRDESRRPFDLRHPPLARFHLIRLAKDTHVLFSNIHHIIADRVSLYILREEVLSISDAIANKTAHTLPDLPIQYVDYAVWAARQQQGPVIQKQIEYWKRKLAGVPAFLELPHSRPRPEKRSSWGATKPVAVSKEHRAMLAKIAAEERTSHFQTFLALFALLLARSSGSLDFCIGSPITHRKHPATQQMVGLFVNMLVFRCELDSAMTFRELLRCVRTTALDAYENSDVPFQTLVRALKPDRRSQRSPVFQVMFGYETYMPSTFDDFQIDTGSGTARYDLSLHLAESASEGIYGSFEYCTDLFEESDIERMISEFEAVVVEVASDPDREVFVIQTKPLAPAPEVKAGVPSMALPSNVATPRGPARWFNFRKQN